MDTSYSELHSEAPFNWAKALSRPVAEIDEEETLDMSVRAESWVTCAVGNQCQTILRKPWGEPTDEELSILGVEFANTLDRLNELKEEGQEEKAERCRLEAIKILGKIETRSTEILIEMGVLSEG